MPKNKRLMSGLLAVPLVTILLITGCSVQNPSPSESPNPSPSISAPADPSATPAPSETSAVQKLEELPAGSPLTPEDRKALKDVDGMGTYTLADGTIVLVRADEPIPPVVINDASTSLTGMGRENEGRIVGPMGADQNLANKLSAESGRNVYVIVHVIPSTPPSDIPTYPVYVLRPFDGQYYDSMEAAQAAAIAASGGDASTVDFVFVDYVG